MRKKKITKLVLMCFLLVAMCLFTSCKKKESKESGEEPGTVHVLNDFEKSADLYAFKPTVTNTVASMSITNKTEGQVREGEGSLKYEFGGGVSPDMLLFVKECSFPELDIANLNKIDVSVYSEKEVEATLSVITTKKAKLMSETYTLKANEWTDLSFRLSALACEYNADKIVGFGLRLDTSEPLTFYVDNWTATMGAENTAEDDKWEPILKKIIKRINNLPKKIKLADGEDLEDLYSDYAELPELYRNIVPNYDELKEAIVSYTELKFASEEDALERKMLAFDEFYGIGQIDGEYPILYQKDVKCEDEKGSIMITFDGSTQESYFAYTTPLDPKRYDYVEMSFYNDDTNRKVIYFNWNQSVLVQPETWATIKIPGEEFHATGNIIVDTINQDGIRINSSGKVYMGTLHAYRRDLLTELKKLPNAADFEMPRDIKYLTLVEKTMELYEKMADTEKAGISEELIENLKACYEKIEGYSTVFDANTEDIQFGTPDCKAQGEAAEDWDEEYGPVYKLNFTAKAEGDYAAGFQFNKDMSEVENLFFYIYNPKLSAQTMFLYADGSWKDLGQRTLEPGWNKIEVPSDIPINTFMFGLFPKTADVVGEWKVTSLYSVSNEIVDRSEAANLAALIEALPDAGSIQMPRDLKYVAAICEAGDAYEALSTNGKSMISSGLKSKLDSCLAAIAGYRAAINARTDEMTAGTYDCACVGTVSRLGDENYGTVFGLQIMAPDSGGDYAAGFQINKDISGSKNMYFYIYNPKNSAQTMYLYADSSWKDLGAKTLNPGWNKIDIPNETKIQQYVFGLFPKGSDVVGQWKISSFYALSDTVVDMQQANEAIELLQKLPSASSIKMPRDLKYVAAIYAANDAYNALSSDGKSYVSASLVKNLQACLKAINGYGVAVNAITDDLMVGTYDCACAGTLNREADKNYGTVFGLKITSAASGDYAAGFQIEKNLSAGKNIYFYVYNPKKTAQTMYLYADSDWKDLGAKTLEPGWNKIDIPNNIKIQKYVFGLLPKGSDVVGTWKITSFYTVSDVILDQEAAASTIEAIKALPSADELTMPEDLKYAADIYAANESYNALSANAKKQVSATLKNKLQACLNALEGYEVVINAKTDEMMVGTYDCACAGTLSRVTDKNYGTVFGLKITSAASGDYAAGFQIEKNLSGKKNIYFYIYNPKKTAQTMYLYADSNWQDLNARTLNPGWNKIEISNDKTIQKYVFGLFPKGSDVVGTWKITSFYTVSDEILDQEAAASTIEAIKTLPSADELTMPEDLKYAADIYAVNEAYNALSANVKKQVSATLKNKLQTCLKALEGYEVVINAKTDEMMVGTPDCQCQGVLKRENDTDYGAVFGLKITSAASGDYAAGFQIEKDLSGKKNIYFYVYNPKKTAQILYLYADSNWQDLNARTLNPGWNKIEISNDKTIQKYVFGLFPKDSDVVGTWKISSFYTVSDEIIDAEKATSVEELIQALPSADALTEENGEAVANAEAAYHALTDAQKALVDSELVEKLNACVAKMEELNNDVSLADKIAQKVILDAAIPNMSYLDSTGAAVSTTPATNEIFGTVVAMPTNAAIVAIEPSRQSEAYKSAEKLSFWIYNPTENTVSGYYTMDWVKNVNITLEGKSWTRIDMDDTSVAQFLTGGKTVYYYINNNNPLGTEGWKVSSFYGDLSPEDISAVDDELRNMTLTLTERLETKVILDAAIPNMTFITKDSVAVPTTSAENALLGTVVVMGSDTAVLAIEPSRQSEAYKSAEKLSFWIYNPTDTNVSGYYTMDWTNNVNITLESKSWTRVDMDDTSVDQFLTGGKTIYYYINNNNPLGTAGWLMSSVYGDVSPEDITAIEEELAQQSVTIADIIAEKIILDAAIPNMTYLDGSGAAVSTTSATNETFGTVVAMTTNAAILAIEPSRQSEAYKSAEKLSFWIYNPTDTKVSGYYTMDWVKNVNITLQSKAWTRIDMDDTSVDQFLTGGKTIYYYINNNNPLGAEGWLMSSVYGDLTAEEIVEVEKDLAPLADRIAKKLILDASIPNMTIWNSGNQTAAITPVSSDVFRMVAGLDRTTSTVIVEGSRKSAAYRGAEKISFWIYNPTDSNVSGYYTMDWVKNVNITLESKTWTRIDVDNTSVDQFITSNSTVYFYLRNGSEVGTTGWLMSSFYGDLTEEENTEITNSLK